MSSLYNLEPQPTAKAVLYTTSGEIALELFGHQAPLATRNFLQHCLDGYYDNTIFHRLVPDFIIQGGDPTGTGSGGQSALEDGAPFADEFHSRLKFNRRGLLGMANTGTKDDNGSQFFLTLGKTEELNGKNTMFGRVEGNTIYNLVKMGEAELVEGEASERPMYPTMIKSTEILVNPFQDMSKRSKASNSSRPAPKKLKSKKKGVAGKQMLSFAGDEDDNADLQPVKAAPKFNAALVQASADKPAKAAVHPRPGSKPPSANETTKPLARSHQPNEPKALANRSIESPSISPSPSPEPQEIRRDKVLAQADAEIAELKQSLKRSAHEPAPSEPQHKRSALDSLMPQGARKGLKRKGDTKSNRQALADFHAFKARLETANLSKPPRSAHGHDLKNIASAPASNTAPEDDDSEEEERCELHFVPNCQSCQKWDEVEDAAEDDKIHEGVLSHRLTFAKDRLGKDLEWKRQNEKELLVIDPREREKEFLKDKRRKKG